MVIHCKILMTLEKPIRPIPSLPFTHVMPSQVTRQCTLLASTIFVRRNVANFAISKITPLLPRQVRLFTTPSFQANRRETPSIYGMITNVIIGIYGVWLRLGEWKIPYTMLSLVTMRGQGHPIFLMGRGQFQWMLVRLGQGLKA